MSGLKVIHEWPAYKLVEPGYRVWCDRDVFAIMFPTLRHGDLPHFFTLGSVVGYACQRGDDPIDAYERAKDRGHKLHWANANGVILTAWKQEQKTLPLLAFGDVIRFEGRHFRLDKASNDNVALVETADPVRYAHGYLQAEAKTRAELAKAEAR